MTFVYKLSDERGEQLRSFAEANSLSIADAVGALLRRAGAADEVPGFNVTPMQTSPNAKPIRFTLAFEGFHAILRPHDLLVLAEHLDHCAAMSGTGGKKITLHAEGTVDLGTLVIARHRRHSVIISGTDAKEKTVSRTLTLDVARDLAEQMRRAVETA